MADALSRGLVHLKPLQAHEVFPGGVVFDQQRQRLANHFVSSGLGLVLLEQQVERLQIAANVRLPGEFDGGKQVFILWTFGQAVQTFQQFADLLRVLGPLRQHRLDFRRLFQQKDAYRQAAVQAGIMQCLPCQLHLGPLVGENRFRPGIGPANFRYSQPADSQEEKD